MVYAVPVCLMVRMVMIDELDALSCPALEVSVGGIGWFCRAVGAKINPKEKIDLKGEKVAIVDLLIVDHGGPTMVLFRFFSVALPRVSDSYSSREVGFVKNHRQNETVPNPMCKFVPKRPFQSHRFVTAMLRSKRNAASTLRIDTTVHN